MSTSTIILLVLSDAYLMREWNNIRFRRHLRNLVTKENTALYCIQMHDVCDEEVEEYFRLPFQAARLISLETDDLLFWRKLGYLLYTKCKKRKVSPCCESKLEFEYRGTVRLDQGGPCLDDCRPKKDMFCVESGAPVFSFIDKSELVEEKQSEKKTTTTTTWKSKQEKIRCLFLLDEIDEYKRQLASTINHQSAVIVNYAKTATTDKKVKKKTDEDDLEEN